MCQSVPFQMHKVVRNSNLSQPAFTLPRRVSPSNTAGAGIYLRAIESFVLTVSAMPVARFGIDGDVLIRF